MQNLLWQYSAQYKEKIDLESSVASKTTSVLYTKKGMLEIHLGT